MFNIENPFRLELYFPFTLRTQIFVRLFGSISAQHTTLLTVKIAFVQRHFQHHISNSREKKISLAFILFIIGLSATILSNVWAILKCEFSQSNRIQYGNFNGIQNIMWRLFYLCLCLSNFEFLSLNVDANEGGIISTGIVFLHAKYAKMLVYKVN